MDTRPQGFAPHLGAHGLRHVDVAGDVRQGLQLARELLQLRNAARTTACSATWMGPTAWLMRHVSRDPPAA